MEYNKIYFGDCIKLLEEVPNNSSRLIIADPPYNLNKNFGNKSDNWDSTKDWLNWTKKWIDACIPKLTIDGSIFIYGIHHYMCYIQCYLYEKDLKYRRQIIWNYENGFAGYKGTLAAHYEPLLWFSKTENFIYHTIREPYKSEERLKHKIVKNGKIWKPHPDGKLSGDVWKIPVLAGKRFAKEKVDHPTQKPLAICDKIIRHFSNENDLVIIPFVGSGSECVSAKSLRRNFIGFEINETYITIANSRLDNYFIAE